MNARGWVSLLILPLLLLVAACDRHGGAATEMGSEPVRLATSISVFADMVRQVGGERVTVVSLVPPGADAHTFQPGPKDVKKLGDVRAVFINGAHLEASLAGVLKNNVPAQARTVELSAGLQPIEFVQEMVGPSSKGGRDSDDEEEAINPHFWLDVQYDKRYV